MFYKFLVITAKLVLFHTGILRNSLEYIFFFDNLGFARANWKMNWRRYICFMFGMIFILPMHSRTVALRRQYMKELSSSLAVLFFPGFSMLSLGQQQILNRMKKSILYPLFLLLFFYLEGFWGQPQGPNFPSPWATMLALRLDCSTAALTTPQTVLSLWKLVELKMLDFSDRTRTGISILTSAADSFSVLSIKKTTPFK